MTPLFESGESRDDADLPGSIAVQNEFKSSNSSHLSGREPESGLAPLVENGTESNSSSRDQTSKDFSIPVTGDPPTTILAVDVESIGCRNPNMAAMAPPPSQVCPHPSPLPSVAELSAAFERIPPKLSVQLSERDAAAEGMTLTNNNDTYPTNADHQKMFAMAIPVRY